MIDEGDGAQDHAAIFWEVGKRLDEFATDVGEAAGEHDAAVARYERLIGAPAVAEDDAAEAEGAGHRIVSEDAQHAFMAAAGLPVEPGVAGLRGVINPEVTGARFSMARIEIVDGRFVDLKFGGVEEFDFDGGSDGGEVAGGGMVPAVECLAADVHIASSPEALGLAVMGNVVLEFVGEDQRGERGGAEGAGDAGQLRGGDDRGPGALGLVDEFLPHNPPPEHPGAGDVEFVVMFLADLFPVVGIGGDFVRDEHLVDDDHEVFREALSFGAAVLCGV